MLDELPPLVALTRRAVMVYVAVAESAMGVPLIKPVELSKVSPAGSEGEIEYEVTLPLVTVTAYGDAREEFRIP